MPERTKQPKRKALLLEDEFLVSLLYQELLEELQFDVLGPVGRVPDALKLLESEPEISVAVLDVNLAGSPSWPVALALKHRNVPVVFATGYGHMHANMPAELREVPILPKPVDPYLFRQTIETVAPRLPLDCA
jgi:CheY-like chemotaxis protein